jgi:hypothetical protein
MSSPIKSDPTPAGVHVIREPKEQIARLDSWGKDILVRLGPRSVPYVVDTSEALAKIQELPDAERQIAFGLIRDPRLRIKKPIPVHLSVEGDTTVAAWSEAEEFGYGSSRAEAIEDFGRTITQLFWTLHREEKSLADNLKAALALLSEHLEFRG